MVGVVRMLREWLDPACRAAEGDGVGAGDERAEVPLGAQVGVVLREKKERKKEKKKRERGRRKKGRLWWRSREGERA